MTERAPLLPDDAIRLKVKAELRKRMRGLRKTMPSSACEERSSRIRARLEAHGAVRSAGSIALFFPITKGNEVDLRATDQALRDRGARVAYPSIDPESGQMTFHFTASTDELGERGHGFREPPPEAEEAKVLDLIVVPALAVAPTGHRLGYGAGYYDRALPRFPGATTIAVIYDFQLLIELPVFPHDVPVRHVVTDARELEASPD